MFLRAVLGLLLAIELPRPGLGTKAFGCREKAFSASRGLCLGIIVIPNGSLLEEVEPVILLLGLA